MPSATGRWSVGLRRLRGRVRQGPETVGDSIGEQQSEHAEHSARAALWDGARDEREAGNDEHKQRMGVGHIGADSR